MLQWEPFAGGHIGPGGRSVRQRRAGRDGARPYRRGERADGGEVRYRECTAAGRCGHRPLRETRVAAGCGHPALRRQGGGVRRNGTPGSSCPMGDGGRGLPRRFAPRNDSFETLVIPRRPRGPTWESIPFSTGDGTPGSSCRTGARRVVCRSGTPGRRALRVQGRGCVVMARRT